MPKPKEAPKIRVYVYAHSLLELKEKLPHLARHTDSEILNYLMTKELSALPGIPATNSTINSPDNEDVD